VPEWLKDEVAEVVSSYWYGARSQYRKCSAIYFGAPDKFNARKTKITSAAGSRKLPMLQQRLVEWIKSVAPCGTIFNRIVINKYMEGESMGEHEDGNDAAHDVQFIARWCTPDCIGGQLWVADANAETDCFTVATGCFMVSGNIPHGVHEVTQGCMWSVVTFCKKLAPCLQLEKWGFPLGEESQASSSAKSGGKPSSESLKPAICYAPFQKMPQKCGEPVDHNMSLYGVKEQDKQEEEVEDEVKQQAVRKETEEKIQHYQTEAVKKLLSNRSSWISEIDAALRKAGGQLPWRWLTNRLVERVLSMGCCSDVNELRTEATAAIPIEYTSKADELVRSPFKRKHINRELRKADGKLSWRVLRDRLVEDRCSATGSNDDIEEIRLRALAAIPISYTSQVDEYVRLPAKRLRTSL